MNLPDVGAGAPFSVIWWLAVVVLFVLGVGGPVMAYRFNRALDRRAEAEKEQNSAIAGALRELHKCQIKCAEHRSEFVRREEMEARWVRIEEFIRRVHERIDAIAKTVGATQK